LTIQVKPYKLWVKFSIPIELQARLDLKMCGVVIQYLETSTYIV